MSEERPFEVVDRRRVRPGAEEAGDEPHAESARPEGQAGAGGEPAAPEGEAGGISVDAILWSTAHALHTCAWVAMGLLPDPATGRVARNLEEARRAIDALADLGKHLEATASPQEKRELQVMLTDLRVNFVRQAGG